MERVNLGAVEFSRIVYGMWRVGDDADTSPAHVQTKLETCLEQGITTIDQADIYGGYTAEAIFGSALKRAPALRDKIEIVTKCDIVAPAGRHAAARVKYYDTTPAHITASVEALLRDMATDYLDLLLIHRPDPLMEPHETGACLDALVASGKVRAVGVSNFTTRDWKLLQSGMTTKLATNQIELSLRTHDAFTNGEVAYLQQKGIRPMAWSPLAGGVLLAEASSALRERMAQIGAEYSVDWSAVAVAWLLRHPAGILPVMGTNSLPRIARLSDATKINMDRQTWFELYSLALGRDAA